MKQRTIIIGICLLGSIFFKAYAQQEFVPQKYFYQDGTLSSEGFLRNGKPDSCWKSYSPKGILLSEGNRKNYLLDGLWKFYDNDGKIQSEIIYKEGKKEGLSRSFLSEYIQEVVYRQDTIVGEVKQMDYHGKILGLIPFDNGKENGWARFFDTLGNIITILQYQDGFVQKREYVNRFNANGLKQGLWKTFNDSGKLVLEENYLNGKKNGYFKYYDQEGNFIRIEKYENDILIEDAVETKHLDRKVDYHPNGQIRTIAHFFKGKPEGIRREYSPEGKVVKSFIFHNGICLGEGIVDDNGKKQGQWKEFYESGKVRALGKYKNGRPIGTWKYLYEDGNVEIEGAYTIKGQKDGQWIWYYVSGNVLSVENYEEGDLNGHIFALSENGDTLFSGYYESGLESGVWVAYNDSVKVQGKYEDGKREGAWKTFYSNGKLKFVENYYNDNLEGKTVYYWENGLKKAEYPYTHGLLNGNVMQYDENGNMLYVTTYKMGIEIKYEGVKVTPTLDDFSFE